MVIELSWVVIFGWSCCWLGKVFLEWWKFYIIREWNSVFVCIFFRGWNFFFNIYVYLIYINSQIKLKIDLCFIFVGLNEVGKGRLMSIDNKDISREDRK